MADQARERFATGLNPDQFSLDAPYYTRDGTVLITGVQALACVVICSTSAGSPSPCPDSPVCGAG